MPRTVTIRSLPQAFAVIKEMQGQDCGSGEDYRAAGRAALAETLAGQMAQRRSRTGRCRLQVPLGSPRL